MAFIHYTAFDENGWSVDTGQVFLPTYLDWMPIKVKAFWFLERGLGEPKSKHLLLNSQGEQLLTPVTSPLGKLKLKQVQENEHGLEDRVNEYARKKGFDRSRRNQ